MLSRRLLSGALGAPDIEYVGGKGFSLANTTTETIDVTGLSGGIGTDPQPEDIIIIAITGRSNTPTDFYVFGAICAGQRFANDLEDCNSSVHVYEVPAGGVTQLVIRGTGGSANGYASISVWRNASPYVIGEDGATAINGGAATPPALTTDVDDTRFIIVGTQVSDEANTRTLTPPTGYTSAFTGNRGTDVRHRHAYKDIAAASTLETPGDFGSRASTSNDAMASFSLLLRKRGLFRWEVIDSFSDPVSRSSYSRSGISLPAWASSVVFLGGSAGTGSQTCNVTFDTNAADVEEFRTNDSGAIVAWYDNLVGTTIDYEVSFSGTARDCAGVLLALRGVTGVADQTNFANSGSSTLIPLSRSATRGQFAAYVGVARQDDMFSLFPEDCHPVYDLNDALAALLTRLTPSSGSLSIGVAPLVALAKRTQTINLGLSGDNRSSAQRVGALLLFNVVD